MGWAAKDLKYQLLRCVGHQDWLRIGIRDRIISRFVTPEIVGSYSYLIDFYGFKYPGNLKYFIDYVVYFYGAYEKQELFFLRDMLLSRGAVVSFDIGANVGQHSLYMSKYSDTVHSFEPYDFVLQALKEKIKLNNIDNIRVHEVGLGDANETMEYFAPTGSNIATGSFLQTHNTDNNTKFGGLQIVNGDEYVSSLNLDKIDLIKIDVEGFEKHVLEGMRTSIMKYRPIIFMEYSSSTRATFSNVLEFHSMFPNAYDIYKVETNSNRLCFFNRPKYRLTKFDFNEIDVNIALLPK